MAGKRKRQRDYSHPSVQALLASSPGQSDPEQIVRERCRSIVDSSKQDGWCGPPFDPFQLASLLGIRTVEVHHDLGAEARIFSLGNEVRIEYRTDIVSYERLRFTIFHELVHTVFPDCYANPRFSGAAVETPAEKEFERLCDIGASELLFPRKELREHLAAVAANLPGICKISEVFKSSVEATTVCILQETKAPIAAVMLQRGARTDGTPAAKTVQCWRSPSFNHFVTPKFMPPRKSVAHIALGLAPNQTTGLQSESWRCAGKWLTASFQAIRLADVPTKPDYPDVMVLVNC